MHWSTKLLLALGAVILVAGALITYDVLTARPVVYETRVPGSEQPQKITFHLEPHAHCVLVVLPFIESGWGSPDVHIEGRLSSPDGETLVTISPDRTFGGANLLPRNRSLSDYEETFDFAASTAGEYVLELQVLVEHVDEVKVAVELEEA